VASGSTAFCTGRQRADTCIAIATRYFLSIALALISSLGLSACTWPTIYRDHQLLRVRVVRIWTNEEIAEDWQAHLRQLADTPPLQSYLREYSRETVFLGHAGRNNRYEYSLALSSMPLAIGDIVEIDIGSQSRAPRAFDDLPMIKRVLCRVADAECLGEPKRGATLG
jgi:hypothetical protein